MKHKKRNKTTKTNEAQNETNETQNETNEKHERRVQNIAVYSTSFVLKILFCCLTI